MVTSALHDAVARHQALAHRVRLRLLASLRDGRLCMGELQELSGLALSTISYHIAELERVGLVVQTKEGRWVWCELGEAPDVVPVLECLWNQLVGSPNVEEDRRVAKRLRECRHMPGCGVGQTLCREMASAEDGSDAATEGEVE